MERRLSYGQPLPALPRPPRGIDLETFYLRYLPELFGAVISEMPSLTRALEIACHIQVDAVTERVFAVVLGPNTLFASAERPCTDPLVTLHCDARAWTTGVRDVWPRLLRLLDRDHGALRERAGAHWRELGPAITAERLRPLAGRIEIDYADDAGDHVAYVVEIAGGRGPRVRLRMEDRELWALLREGGRLLPWLQSRVGIEGDAGYLVRVAMVRELR